MKKIIILIIILCGLQTICFSQNLEWKLFNNDCGKNISDIFEYETNKFIVKSELGFFKIHDGITEEIQFPLTSNYIITSINMDSSGILYVATERNGIFRYDNLKNEWEDIHFNIIDIANKQIFILNKKDVILTHNYREISELNYEKGTWIKLFDNIPKLLNINDNRDMFSVGIKDFEYLLFGDSIWRKNDLVTNLLNYGDVQNLHFSLYEIDMKIYLINDDGGIFYSDDLMKTINYNNVVRDVFNNFIKLILTKDKEWIMLSSSEGILYSNNNAKTFEQNNEGLPSDSVLAGIITKNENILISIKNQGLYISEKPKNILITDNMGWLERPNFKARKVFNCKIGDLKFSNDGKKLYTSAFTYMYGGNHIIQLSILDVETGKLLKNYRIPSDDLMYFNVSDDDKYIIAYYLTYVFDSFDYTVKVVIYNLEDLSIKYHFELKRNYPDCNLNLNYDKYFSAIFDDNKNEIIFSYSLTNICKNGSKYQTISEIVHVDFNYDSSLITVLYNKPIQIMIKINDNKLLFWEYDLTEDKPMDDIFESYLFKMSECDFSNQIIITADSNMNNIKYSRIHNFKYNRAKNHAVFRNWNDSISIYDLNSNSLLKKIRLDNIYTNTYDFSIDGKKMLIFHNKGIAFFKYPEMELIDSIPFKFENGYWWRPAISPDNKSFAVGTYDGVVRLMKSDILASVNNRYKVNSQIDNFLIYPNPASDYIEINTGSKEHQLFAENAKIQIFNVFGNEVISTLSAAANNFQEGKLRIDISGLTPGVYFIRIGDKTEKFVKM